MTKRTATEMMSMREYEYILRTASEDQKHTDEMKAIGMLLDAEWIQNSRGGMPVEDLFVKRIRRVYANGLATYFDLFYNARGEEVPMPKGWKSA